MWYFMGWTTNQEMGGKLGTTQKGARWDFESKITLSFSDFILFAHVSTAHSSHGSCLSPFYPCYCLLKHRTVVRNILNRCLDIYLSQLR